MHDGINQVGKSLGKTKRNSEAALRRYVPIIPKIERTRDIFDDVIPFEMSFEVTEGHSEGTLDLHFNKPPPVRSCRGGRFGMCCDEFTTDIADSGPQLLQISPYISGSVTVFRNDVELTVNVNFVEYDHSLGLVYIAGTSTSPQHITICYVRDTYLYACADEQVQGVIVDAPISSDGGFSAEPRAQNPPFFYSPTQYPIASNIFGLVNIETSTTGVNAGYISAEFDSRYGGSFGTSFVQEIQFYGDQPNIFNPGNSWETLNWGEFEAKITVNNHCDNLPNYTIDPSALGLTGAAQEIATATIHIGDIAIGLSSFKGDRDGFFPLFGPPKDPRGQIEFFNSGFRDKDLNYLGSLHSTDVKFETAFNPGPIEITVVVNQPEGYIKVDAGGFEYKFDNPYFGSFGRNFAQGFYIDWDGYTKFNDPYGFGINPFFFLSAYGASLKTCTFVPDVF